jgi:hypothetical protein
VLSNCVNKGLSNSSEHHKVESSKSQYKVQFLMLAKKFKVC